MNGTGRYRPRGIFIDNNAKTMVMLDGQQITKRSHFGYTSLLFSPLLGDIKQVEVILGPGAILHGSTYGEDKNIYVYGGAYGAEGIEPDELYGYTKTFDIHAGGFDGGNYRTSQHWNHKGFNLKPFLRRQPLQVRHVVKLALNYRITKDVLIGVSVHNLFATDVPPMVFEPDRLDRGGIGYDERRVYVSLKTQL